MGSDEPPVTATSSVNFGFTLSHAEADAGSVDRGSFLQHGALATPADPCLVQHGGILGDRDQADTWQCERRRFRRSFHGSRMTSWPLSVRRSKARKLMSPSSQLRSSKTAWMPSCPSPAQASSANV